MIIKQQGFALISAIFILVILTMLAGFAVNVFGVTQSTTAYAMQGNRAYFAARSGIEWGVFKVVDNPASCPSTLNYAINEGHLKGFSVKVTCSSISVTENPNIFNIFTITSWATKGNFGEADYVSRRIKAYATIGV